MSDPSSAPMMGVDDLRDASRERLLAEIGTLQHQSKIHRVADLHARIVQLEAELQQVVDYNRGAAAEVGELRARLDAAQREATRLRREADDVRRSRSYRIGTLVLKPLRLAARIVRRLAGSR